jgi:hypothetical protein
MPTQTIATGGEDALEASSVEADAIFNYLPLLLKSEVVKVSSWADGEAEFGV